MHKNGMMLDRNTCIHSKIFFLAQVSVDNCKLRLHRILSMFLFLDSPIFRLIHQIKLICPAEVIKKVQCLIKCTWISHLFQMYHLSPQLTMFCPQINKIDDILNHFPLLILYGQLLIRTWCFLWPIDCEIVIDPNFYLVPSIDALITAQVPIILSLMPKIPCFLYRSLNPLSAVFRITSACLESIDFIWANL